MKNKIYSYFFREFLSFFIIILFSLAAIVWAVQAVNYLELVIEDGHTFTTYFGYSLLTIPKTITKLLPFTFLVSIVLTILRFEKNNELIVLWTSGINKIKIVNIILTISIIITFLQVVLASTVSPTSLTLSRSLLKNSELNFFSSMLKEKQFNDTVKNLTIFVDKKNPDGTVENIFLRDDTKSEKEKNNLTKEKKTEDKESSTIFAKRGYLTKRDSLNILVLFDGVIQKESSEGRINFLNFSKTEFNLSQYSSKTITWPKVQERASLGLLRCIMAYNKDSINIVWKFLYKIADKINLTANILDTKTYCLYKNRDIINEMNRRIGMPLYIPLLSLIACYLLSSRKENKKVYLMKYIYGFIGFAFLIFAETSVRYSGKFFYITVLYYLVPIIITFLNYLLLYKVFKYETLR